MKPTVQNIRSFLYYSISLYNRSLVKIKWKQEVILKNDDPLYRYDICICLTFLKYFSPYTYITFECLCETLMCSYPD